jgi:hypothetical protein
MMAKNQDIFSITHSILSKYKQVLAKLEQEHTNEFQSYLDCNPFTIYCSSQCSKPSTKEKIVRVTKSNVLPKSSLPVHCASCKKELQNQTDYYLIIQKGKNISESLGITKNNSSDIDMIYEIYLNARILGYLLRYTSNNYLDAGIAYSPGLLETVALKWISLIIPNLSIIIPNDSTYYRVQRSLHTQVNKANLNNLLLMRNTDREHVGTGRFNRPGSWYLYLASDLETAVKESRIPAGTKFFSAEFVVQKGVPCLDARLSTLKDNINLDYENKEYRIVLQNGANLPLYVLLSSGLLAMNIFMQSVSTTSDDAKKFQRIYFISQSIADVIKKNGLAAILYDSTKNPGGENLSFLNNEEIDDYFIQHKTVQH